MVNSNIPNNNGFFNTSISAETLGKGARYVGAGLVFTGVLTGNPVVATVGSVLSASGSATEFGSKALPAIDRAMDKIFPAPQLQPAFVR